MLPGPLFSGALFRQLLQELEAELGHDAVWTAVGALPAEARSECLEVLGIRWVHAATSVELFKAAASRANRDPHELHRLILTRSTEKVFTTLWRAIFRFVSSEAMIARIPVVFGRTYSGITAEGVDVAPGKTTIVIRGWPAMDELSLQGIAVSIGVAMKVAVGTETSVRVERTADGARYAVRWKERATDAR